MTRRRTLVVVLTALITLASCSEDTDEQARQPPTKTSAAPTTARTGATDTSAAAGSPGCEGEPPSPGRTVVTVVSDERERTYIRYVPSGLDPSQPAPLVLDVTAYAPASIEEAFSGFTRPDADGSVKADEVGAIVVTPEPVNGAGALLTWNFVGTPGWTDDQRFVTDVLDDVEADACIDTDRVLAMGFAIGGVFASITACGQADRIAVLVTVAGLYSPDGCRPSEPLPVLSFHGTGDRFVPFDGGVGPGAGGLGLSAETTTGLVFMASRPGAVASSQAWADHAGCADGPTDDLKFPGVMRTAWSRCDDGADVELYVIDGGEHTWPGSNGMAAYEGLLGPVSDAVVANDVIWDFFEAHTS